MAYAIQRRRGTATEHNTFTGLAGEITIDTHNTETMTVARLVIHQTSKVFRNFRIRLR